MATKKRKAKAKKPAPVATPATGDYVFAAGDRDDRATPSADAVVALAVAAKDPKGKKAKEPTRKSGRLEVMQQAIAAINKDRGMGTADTLAHGCRSVVKEVLPTGIAVLDYHVLGIGGLPYGRVVEVFGKESCGKASLGFQLMAQAQKDDALVAFGEAEPAISPA